VTLWSNRSTPYPITDFHPSDQRDVIGNLDRFGLVGLELFPIRIQQKLYVIDKRGTISNEEVFKAVCNGYSVDLSVMQDSQGKSKIIDI
jgi:hypothetical protein